MYLVGLVGSGCSNLALLARSKLSKVAVVVTLPVIGAMLANHTWMQRGLLSTDRDIHLVIEDLGLSRLSLGDQRLVQHIKNILADFLEFGLDLLAVVTDSGNVFVGTLGLFLLLDRGDNAPGSTSSADDILVGNGQQVSLIDCELSAQLCHALLATRGMKGQDGRRSFWRVPWQPPSCM